MTLSRRPCPLLLPADPNVALPDQSSPTCPRPAGLLRAESCDWRHLQVFLLRPPPPLPVKAVDACGWGHIPYLREPQGRTGRNSAPSSRLSLERRYDLVTFQTHSVEGSHVENCYQGKVLRLRVLSCEQGAVQGRRLPKPSGSWPTFALPRLPLRPRIDFLPLSGLRSWDPKGKAEQPVRQP